MDVLPSIPEGRIKGSGVSSWKGPQAARPGADQLVAVTQLATRESFSGRKAQQLPRKAR